VAVSSFVFTGETPVLPKRSMTITACDSPDECGKCRSRAAAAWTEGESDGRNVSSSWVVGLTGLATAASAAASTSQAATIHHRHRTSLSPIVSRIRMDGDDQAFAGGKSRPWDRGTEGWLGSAPECLEHSGHPKFETRNPKSETNSKQKNNKAETKTPSKGEAASVSALLFAVLDLFRISDFEFRI
jgi:hypothetical protein